MSQTAETNSGLTRKQWIVALLLGLLLLGGIAGGIAFVLRPPKPQISDLADLNETPAPPAVPNAADKTPAPTPDPARVPRRPVALAEADGMYKRSETRMDFIAKSAIMTVSMPGGDKYMFSYSFRPRRVTDPLYGLITRMIQDPATYADVGLTAEQIARINAIPTSWVFPDSDKPALEERFRIYASTPDGAAKEAAKGELLATLGVVGDKAFEDLQQRMTARVLVLLPQQIIKCRAIQQNPRVPRLRGPAAPGAAITPAPPRAVATPPAANPAMP